MKLRPDLEIRGVRGNVETRLRKLQVGEYDGLVMAHAGLKRVGLDGAITEAFDERVFLPAPGQGTLAVQTRTSDQDVIDLARSLDHTESHCCLDIERALLAKLRAGCSTPIGGLASVDDAGLHLRAVVLDIDGTQALRAEASAPLDNHGQLVDRVVDDLLAQGAADLITEY